MNFPPIRHFLIGATALSMASLAPSALACAACFGRSDDSMARGMNMGIFALLMVILLVLAGIASFAIFLAKRSARMTSAANTSAFPAELSAQFTEPISQPTP